jgi:hypothetical protein
MPGDKSIRRLHVGRERFVHRDMVNGSFPARMDGAHAHVRSLFAATLPPLCHPGGMR